MPVGQLNLSPLQPPTAVNPLGEALGSAINAYYKPQEKGAQVSLLKAQANQANATANFTAPQIAATLLSNPALRDNMDSETIKRLAKYASSALDAGVTRAQNQSQSQNNNPFVNLFHKAFGLDHLNEPHDGQPTSEPSPQNMQNQDNSHPDTPQNDIKPIMDNGGANSQAKPTIMPDTQANRTANALKIPGTSGGVNSYSANEAQEAATKTTATTEAGNIQQQWKDKQDMNAKKSDDALTAMNQNANILHSYPKMGWAEKGPVFGKTPAVTTAAQDYERYIAARANSISMGFSGNDLTKPQMDAGKALKVSRENTGDSVHHAMAFDNGLQARIMQHQIFDKKAQALGLLPTEADILWSRYKSEKPFWDPDNERIIRKNMDYNPYFTEKMINWARSPDAVSFMKKEVKNGNVPDNVGASITSKPAPTEANQSSQVSDANTFKASPAAIQLSKTMKLPSFNSPEEFNDWLDKQDSNVQQAVTLQLMEKKRNARKVAGSGKMMELTNTKYVGEG